MRLLLILLCLPVATAAADIKQVAQPGLLDPLAGKPPEAAQVDWQRVIHDDILVDPYVWLQDADDPDVLDYLKAENAYTEAVMAPVADLEDTLFDEMIGRLVEDDAGYPIRFGDYWYHWRIAAGQDHWTLVRHTRGPRGPEEVLIDINALAEGRDYYDIVDWEVTRDGRYLAYLEDTSGGLRFDLTLIDLATGGQLVAPIADVDNFAWAPDGQSLYYVAADASARAHQLRHVDVTDDQATPRVLYTEEDPEFSLYVGLSADRRFIVASSVSSDTSEVRFIDPYEPDADAIVILPRRSGIHYGATHAGGEVVMRINDTSQNYRIVGVDLAALRAGATGEAFRTLVAARPDVVIEGASITTRNILVDVRQDGKLTFEIVDRATGDVRSVVFDEPAYSAWTDWAPEYDTDIVHYGYESPITPWSVYALNMATGESTLVQRDPVPGGFDPEDYEVRRIFAIAEDGTRVPVTVAFNRTVPLDGTAPLLLEAYGAYGATYDPYFDRTLISLLERGVIYAYAHVRGGGEYGDDWYDAGRLANKMNTFTDTIAVAEHLIAEGYASPETMALAGTSAGGLTVGAVINLRPDLFRAAILTVPFVDVLTAMLDPDLPLTTIEYPEWGNPEKPDAYRWIRAYDPYQNLDVRDYPALLVVAGLTDDQVPYWQPAKYVASLRTLVDSNDLVLLHTDLESGHAGASGRSGGLRRWAFEYAFLLGVLGVAE